MRYGKKVLIAHDQLFNALLGGWPDETLSSRAYRWRRNGTRAWPCRLIDGLFFWDRERATGRRHCELSYLSEVRRMQLPPEFRREEGGEAQG